MTLVVDASVAIKWLLPEILADHAARLLEGNWRLAAPDFLLVEFGNIVWKKVRLGEVTSSDAEAALQRLSAGPVNLTPTRPLVGTALRLACELDHPVYDCIYLAAAEALDAVVVTADRRLFERTRATPWADRLQWLGALAG